VQVTFQHYADPNSSGADGIVTIFSDAKVNPVAGGSGGSLGYAQYSSPSNSPGFAGGWLGVGIDEFGNFSNPTENRYLGPGAKANSVTIRGPSNSFYTSGTASNYANGYPYLTSANSLSPSLASSTSSGGPGDYFRISIDSRVPGEQWIQVERSTDGTTYSTPVSYFNLMDALKSVFGGSTQLPAIPTNFWLSFSGGTGGSTNIHELTNLQVCATKMVSASPVINHFRFELPVRNNVVGSMDTCQAATMKVTACTAASPACSPLTGTDAYVTLKPTGWVGGDSVTLINGQATLQLSQTSSGTITPDIDRTKTIFPAMVNSSTASDCVAPGGTNTSNTIPCSIIVAQSTSGFGVTFPTASVQSCADSGLVTIKACSASYASTTKNLQYWFSYTDPSAGTLPVTLSTDSWVTTKTLSNATPSSATNPATISATFDSSAQSKVRIKYSDVGKVTLNVRDSAATTVTGSSSVIFTPASFAITAVQDLAGNANPAASDATGSKFVAAGSSFRVTAQALNSCATPAVTPNFGQESTREGIALAQSVPTGLNLSLPSAITVVSDFGFTKGVGTATVSWPEVGILQLTPNLKSGNYMGTVNVTGAKSGTIGRFYADHFDVGSSSACNGFTYDRQPFNGFTVTAKSADGNTLTNYTGSSNPALNFARVVTLSDSTGYGTMPQVAASNFPSDPGATHGVASLTGAAATYTFNVNPTAPITASIGAADTDNPASTGVRASMPIRSGRVRMSNAYGSELLDLNVPMWSEYYSGTYWTKNTADTCTTLQSPYLVFSGPNSTLRANTCVWDSGNPGASGKGCSAAATGTKANRKFLQGGITGADSSGNAGFAGNFNVWLKAPGVGNTGGSNKTMTVTATVPDWLKYNWGSGAASPSGQASFNVYKSPLIYFRENY
jgi:MSHA biogenesis protein MshQ